MPLCAAFNCNNRHGSAPKLGDRLSFYKFPNLSKVDKSQYNATKLLIKRWVHNIKRKDLDSKRPEDLKHYYVCSDHFEDRMYECPQLRLTRKKNSYPTLVSVVHDKNFSQGSTRRGRKRCFSEDDNCPPCADGVSPGREGPGDDPPVETQQVGSGPVSLKMEPGVSLPPSPMAVKREPSVSSPPSPSPPLPPVTVKREPSNLMASDPSHGPGFTIITTAASSRAWRSPEAEPRTKRRKEIAVGCLELPLSSDDVAEDDSHLKSEFNHGTVKGTVKTISVEDKLRLIRAYREDEDYLRVADLLGIKRTSARSIVYLAMKRDDPEKVENAPRGGARNVKVDDEMRAFIEEALGRNPAITLKNLNLQMQASLPLKPKISSNHLGKVCHGMFYTIKKLGTPPSDRDRPNVKEERLQYATWFLQSAQFAPRLVYVDEVGFNVWIKRTRGSAPAGPRAVRTVCGQRGEHVTIILAVSPQTGVERHSFHSGGTTVAKFGEFFTALESEVGLDTACIFVMDSTPCHRAVAPISASHSVRLLPPDSPMLSPMENAFSAWKGAIKASLSEPAVQQTFSDRAEVGEGSARSWRRHLLLEHGEAALSAITAQKCAAWQQHCTSFFPQCLSREEILMPSEEPPTPERSPPEEPPPEAAAESERGPPSPPESGASWRC